VKQLVTEGRLVTLTGMAGVGKTRLAVHVARELEQLFPDGVWFADLTEATEETLASTVVAALGLDQPERSAEEEVLLEHLASRRILLVLDGCEHVREACGRLVLSLLSAAHLTILATSRGPFRLPGEHVWAVPPMSSPSDEELLTAGPDITRRFDALALFEDRAGAVLPGFAVGPGNQQSVAALCRRLDGLPLAIELAAVRMRSLSVEEVLARLTDPYRLLVTGDRSAAPRHQTLRAAMERSAGLCSDVERSLWARLSVFSDGFELEDAEAVCSGDGLSPEDVFAAVSGLVDKSILELEGRQSARYRLFNTVRDFGRDLLRGDPIESSLRYRYLDYFVGFAERADAEWFGPQQVKLLTRCRAERENLGAAMDLALAEDRVEHAQRLVTALWFLWLGDDLVEEGRRWLARALTVQTRPSVPRGRALMLAGLLTVLREDPVVGLSLLEDSKTLATQLGPDGSGLYGNVTVLIKLLTHDLEGAVEWLRQVRCAQPEETDGLGFLNVPGLAMVSVLRGDAARGIELCERASEVCDRHGELWGKSWLEAVLGLAHWSLGSLEEAVGYLRRSLRLKHLFPDVIGIGVCVEVLSWIAAAQGDGTRAARLLCAQLPVETQFIRGSLYSEWHSQCVSRVRHLLRSDELHEAEREGARLGLDDLVGYALGISTVRTREEPTQLTRREWEVARLVSRGLSNRDIADKLVISKRTSDSHVEHILAKLGFTSRAEIAGWVAEREPGGG
jgi:non-specific serine/threonine protein kinase